jgi:Mn-containing catalase
MGDPWTADYLKITGELDVDLRSNIAAEARAKIVYERLINFCNDVGTKDALQFLMTREITHMKAFAAALDSMDRDRFSIGKIAPSKNWQPHYQPAAAAGYVRTLSEYNRRECESGAPRDQNADPPWRP